MPGTPSLLDVASPYEAVVFDQWGVLHDGTVAYAGAAMAMERLRSAGKRLAVLSNSGKRAARNVERIAAMGLPMDHVAVTMTSGEAFWSDCKAGLVDTGPMLAITGNPNDAKDWAKGLDAIFIDRIEDAQTVLLMGLPEGSDGSAEKKVLSKAAALGLPMICTNPDRASPRANGQLQLSPGALAHDYRDQGGRVTFYGKPHRPIFDRLVADLRVEPASCLMVGDSLEHDVAGAHGAGMASALVTTGIHARKFAAADDAVAAARSLAAEHVTAPPTHVIASLV